MKIAVPTMGDKGLDEAVGEHFGRVPTYTIVNTETNEVGIIGNTSQHMGGQGYPPDILAEEGVDVMICSGLGHRAIMMFQEYGIRVFVGAHGPVKNAVYLWKKGRLQEATDETACRQHAFRGEKHGSEVCKS